MAELTFYVEYEVKETFTETITIEYHDDDVDDVLERIKEEIEDRIKAYHQYAYLKKQHRLACHMEEDYEDN